MCQGAYLTLESLVRGDSSDFRHLSGVWCAEKERDSRMLKSESKVRLSFAVEHMEGPGRASSISDLLCR